MRAAAPVLALLLSAALVPDVAAQVERRRKVEPVAAREFTLRQRTEIERLAIENQDVRATRPTLAGLTDLMIELRAPAGDLDAALATPNGRHRADAPLLLARVFVVSAGRLIKDTTARCGGFEGDIAVCTVECEAGRFGLRRRKATEATELALMLGNLPRDIDTETRPGFAVNACAIEHTSETRIVPAKGRVIVEIAIRPDPQP